MNEADPLGLFPIHTSWSPMAKAAILIDGGYFLKRLPSVRPDVDNADVEAVVASIDQLIRGHLSKKRLLQTQAGQWMATKEYPRVR